MGKEGAGKEKLWTMVAVQVVIGTEVVTRTSGWGRPPECIGKKGEGKVLEILKGVDWHTRGTRRELEKARLTLRRLRAEARQEPLDYPVRLVPAVVNEPGPVVHVDLRHPPNEQLQLVLVKHAAGLAAARPRAPP